MPEGRPDDTSTTGLGYDLHTDRRASASGFLLDAVRRRKVGRTLLSGLTFVLFIAGAGMFAYPIVTDIYSEQVIQGGLADDFAGLQVDSYEDWADQVSRTGAPLTKIVMPDIDVEMLVVEGTSPSALRAGAGHYPNSPLPGQEGNVAIAGHRTTYGKPFNRLDELQVGARIWLVTPVGDHVYEVVEPPVSDRCVQRDPTRANCITDPRDWGVVEPAGNQSLLTLTTCHPKGSAAERLVVRAELVRSRPAGTFEQQRERIMAIG
jgi:sortase A